MPRMATSTKPRVLLVGRTRYRLPLSGAEGRKFSALGQVACWHLLARASRSQRNERLTLTRLFPVRALDGLVFHLQLPFLIARLIGRLRPDVVIAQDPYIGAAALLARRLRHRRTTIVIEVHGDWRTATHLYGSRARRLLARPAHALAAAALRRADAVRAISGYTAELVRAVRGSVDAVFPTFLDLEPFLARGPVPLPNTPTVLFVGALERYKNVDRLLAIWPRVHARVPDGHLHIVGTGALAPLVKRAATRDQSITYTPVLSRDGVARALDASTCLVLPSRSEGMGRVVAEALTRGRPVVASRVGGLPELVHDGNNGLLVDPDDGGSLQHALELLLTNPRQAARLAANASASATHLQTTPGEWARSIALLVETALRISRAADARPVVHDPHEETASERLIAPVAARDLPGR